MRLHGDVMNNKKEFRINYGGKEVILETGRLAKQADGSVLVTCEGSQVLVTVCCAKKLKDGIDFFPLLVDYTEKYYAAGKFVGGFKKREGRPSTSEILNSRIIDRPLRPLFPKGFMYETVILPQCLSYDPAADPEVLGALGAAAALAISDIPFNGPLGMCKVGKIDGKLVLNPHHDDWEKSEIEMSVAASKDAILMIEGEAKEVSEKDMLEAINFAHKNIKEFCHLIDQMSKECGKPKREFTPPESLDGFFSKVSEKYSTDARSAISIADKLERQDAVQAIMDKVKEEISADFASFSLEEKDADRAGALAYQGVDEMLYHMMRNDILNENKRIGGRDLTKVRPIEVETDILKRVHGSSLFTRGETQVMSTVTIGGSDGDEKTDGIRGYYGTKFYLHYTFSPYCVGEARGYRGVGRREMGHGNLAERALKYVVPSQDDFAYTIRVCCETLESNGSSSMGSVCAGSMAMMDAGIPIKAPVAGVAMGLIMDEKTKNYKVLTDILGDEDHLGDMDFKVAGTKDGITAIQMDIKISGITEQIMEEAMKQALDGRLHILDKMADGISAHRSELKDGVPKMESLKIAPDKIGALIGPGGKNIKSLQEKYEVNIEVEEDGQVKIMGVKRETVKDCLEVVALQINGPEKGKDYPAKVVTIKEYGAFVDIADGVSGLVHISELANERVSDVNDYLSIGDDVNVRVLDIDRFGKIKMSIKAVEPLMPKN